MSHSGYNICFYSSQFVNLNINKAVFVSRVLTNGPDNTRKYRITMAIPQTK